MPRAIKKRTTKKTGLKEEEVKGAVVRSLDRIKERKRIFIPVISATGIVVVLTVIIMLYSSSVKEKAYLIENEAYKYYYKIDLKVPLTEEGRWRKSLELFQEAIDVKSTPSAQFYLGNCYFNLGDYDNAIEAYNKFIDKYKNKEIILPLVYQKLVSAYIKKDKYDEAIRTLDDLAEFREGTFKDAALILKARYYETAGKHEDAVEIYKELVEGFPSSPWAQEANAKIAMTRTEEDKESTESDKSATEGGLENTAE